MERETGSERRGPRALPRRATWTGVPDALPRRRARRRTARPGRAGEARGRLSLPFRPPVRFNSPRAGPKGGRGRKLEPGSAPVRAGPAAAGSESGPSVQPGGNLYGRCGTGTAVRRCGRREARPGQEGLTPSQGSTPLPREISAMILCSGLATPPALIYFPLLAVPLLGGPAWPRARSYACTLRLSEARRRASRGSAWTLPLLVPVSSDGAGGRRGHPSHRGMGTWSAGSARTGGGLVARVQPVAACQGCGRLPGDSESGVHNPSLTRDG